MKKQMKQKRYLLLLPLFFSSCHSLDSMLYEPKRTPETWCDIQPCSEIFGIVINQPTSSILVYFLAFFTLFVGRYFWQTQNEQKTRFWWSISLFLTGIGAALAGTSYQAFGYEIKCVGHEFCVWTSWWELFYNITTVIGAAALLLAVAAACMIPFWQKISAYYAFVSSILYMIIIAIGVFLQNKFLLSFEMMILFTSLPYLFILGLNIWQFFTEKKEEIGVLLGAWLGLCFTMICYTIYLNQNITQKLWAEGIWFSENDVLHLLMIFWIAYVYKYVGKTAKDLI